MPLPGLRRVAEATLRASEGQVKVMLEDNVVRKDGFIDTQMIFPDDSMALPTHDCLSCLIMHATIVLF